MYIYVYMYICIYVYIYIKYYRMKRNDRAAHIGKS